MSALAFDSLPNHLGVTFAVGRRGPRKLGYIKPSHLASIEVDLIKKPRENYNEYLTVPNPDFCGKMPGAVRSKDSSVQHGQSWGPAGAFVELLSVGT